MKTEVVCECDVERMFPTPFCDVEQVVDGLSFAFEPIVQQGFPPSLSEEYRVGEQAFTALDDRCRGVHPLGRLDEFGQIVLIGRIL